MNLYVRICPKCKSVKNRLKFNNKKNRIISQCLNCGYEGTLFRAIKETYVEKSTNSY